MGPSKIETKKVDPREEKFDKLNLENIDLRLQVFDLQSQISQKEEELANIEVKVKANHFDIIDKEIQKLLDKDIN